MMYDYPYYGSPNYIDYKKREHYRNSEKQRQAENLKNHNFYSEQRGHSSLLYKNNLSSRRVSPSAKKPNFHITQKNNRPFRPIQNVSNPSLLNSSNSKSSSQNDDRDFFDIFGVRLYMDDLIIIALLYFLYSEGVRDYELFISLILLLLS